jgi:hypothetical protein
VTDTAPVESSRDSSRWLLLAVTAALWCVAWPWGLLELTRGYPGVLSFKGHRGAYEVVEALTHLPASMALFAEFLLVLLIGWCVASSRRWLDPFGVVTQSVRWAFSSRSLNVGAIAFATITFFVPLALYRGRGDASALFGMATMLLVMLASFLAPFCAWNPATLARDQLARWWIPAWPGWNTVLMSISLGLVSGVLDLAFSALPEKSAIVELIGLAAGSALNFMAWIFVATLWIDAGSFAAARRDFRDALRWPMFRQLLWQWILGCFVFFCVLVPVVSVAVMTIYIIPQYAASAKAHGQPLCDRRELVRHDLLVRPRRRACVVPVADPWTAAVPEWGRQDTRHR